MLRDAVPNFGMLQQHLGVLHQYLRHTTSKARDSTFYRGPLALWEALETPLQSPIGVSFIER